MFTARGLWRHEAEFLEAREPGAEIELVCDAAGVNAVLAPAGTLEVMMDGSPVGQAERGADLVERDGRTFAVWDRSRLVHLVDGTFSRRLLTLRFPSPGTRLYALSFTSAC
jgi:hypothetical protein